MEAVLFAELRLRPASRSCKDIFYVYYMDREDMVLTISSQELQKQIGEAQIEAAKAPVIVTSHGRPRSVLMSVDEFVRLKELAGEPVVIDGLRKRAMTLRASVDELGYDVADPHAAILRMARDANSGRTRAAVQAELAAVRRRYGGNPR